MDVDWREHLRWVRVEGTSITYPAQESALLFEEGES